MTPAGRLRTVIFRTEKPKVGGQTTRPPTVPARDCDCDQGTPQQAGQGETASDGTMASAEASIGMSDRPGQAETALGLLITQRSRVQIPPPLPVSAGQGPFPVGRGP